MEEGGGKGGLGCVWGWLISVCRGIIVTRIKAGMRDAIPRDASSTGLEPYPKVLTLALLDPNPRPKSSTLPTRLSLKDEGLNRFQPRDVDLDPAAVGDFGCEPW